MNPVRRRVADYAANLRTWSTERPQSVPCCSEVDEICCNHRVISLSAALCLTHCFKFRTDLGQFRRDRRNQWIRQESRGDVPIAVEIGEAGVTGLRTYAASAVGSRAG